MAKKKRTPKPKRATGAILPEDSFAPIAKELALAYARINGAPARRLKWLLNFSELNLESLSDGRLADLRWELVVFALNRKPEEMKSRFGIYSALTLLTLPDTGAKRNSLSEIRKGIPETQDRRRVQEDSRGQGIRGTNGS